MPTECKVRCPHCQRLYDQAVIEGHIESSHRGLVVSAAIDRFQAAVVDKVPTVIDTKTERFISHAAEWGAEQMQTVLESLAARPTNVALFDWEGLR